MRYTVIDVGSNTVKYDLYSVKKETFTIIKHHSTSVRLIGYIREGTLSDDGLEKLCEVLKGYKTEAAENGCMEKNIYVFATASFRRLHDPQPVVEQVALRTGLSVVVLSGEEEARCSFLGMLSAQEQTPARGVMIDMGGGSTELYFFAPGASFIHSCPFGALSLKNEFSVGKVLPPETDRALRAHVSSLLPQIPPQSTGLWENVGDAYLVGGTARACAKLSAALTGNEKSGPMTRAQFGALTGLLASPDERRYEQMQALCPDRYMLMSSGCTAYDEIFGAFGAERIHLCRGGIREGYLQLKTRKNLKEKKEKK